MHNEDKTNSLEIVKVTLKYFFPTAWRYKKGYFFLISIHTLFSIIQPFISIFFMPLIIDELLGGREIKKLVTYAALLVVLDTIVSYVMSVINTILEKYSTKFENYFAIEMSKRVMELDFQLTEDKNALDQIEKARQGLTWYSGGIHGLSVNFFSIISNIFKICGVIVLLILHAPILFLLTVLILVFETKINRKKNLIEIENYTGLAKINRIFGYVLFELSNFRFGKDIRLYGASDMMLEKSKKQIDNMTGIWKNTSDRQLPLSWKNDYLNVIRDFITYFYLGFLAITSRISIGIFSQMLSASGTFHNSLQGLIYGIQEITKKSNYAHEYVKFMHYPPAMQSGTKKLIDTKKHMIEFRNVSFAYPNTDVSVLKDVSITIHPEEHLSIVGLNGAGKTTFIKLLCRLYDVDNGVILLDGVNIQDYEYDEYMKLFSVVFQDFKLLSFSMKENIILDHEDSDENVKEYIKLAGLLEKVESLPDGMDTMVFKQFDEKGIEPSGGEQQKLAIARALYKNSPVVILDEPTAALDPVAEYEIYRQFDTLVGGKTAVYISHRLSSCKFCDRIAVFSEGSIKELGTHDELVNIKDGLYAEMFHAQAQYYT